MPKKKIYIAGCGGMLGEAFYVQFRDDYELRCTDIDVNEDWLSFLDFRDFESYKEDVINFRPDYLFHLGAYTDLEYCQRRQDDTYLTNAISVENAVYIANYIHIPLLYISTAGIFDGKKNQYDEWDTPNPICHYARAKYAGEVFVRENTRKHLICRAGWMMGGGPKKDKKFVHKIMKQVKDGKKELFIVNDKMGTPTYTHDFAKNVKVLLQTEYWGLYNMVCQGVTSRLEVAEHILKIINMDQKIKITEVPSSYFSKEYFAPRPDSERLVSKKLQLRNMYKMRHWKNALSDYIDQYYKDYLQE